MARAVSLHQKFGSTQIDLDTVLFHVTVLLFPLVLQWTMVHMAADIRSQMAVYQNPPENVLTSDRKMSLEEIKAQPTPTPEQFELMFSAYSNYYGIDRGLLRTIAYCESRFRPTVTNPSGKYVGLYQFDIRTWKATRERMGVDPDPNLRYDAEQSIKTAAFKIMNSGSGAWVVCSGKYYGRS